MSAVRSIVIGICAPPRMKSCATSGLYIEGQKTLAVGGTCW
jgi:hypothetical protein